MALWRKKAVVLDLTETPGCRCPSCGGMGSADYVDLVLQKTSYTCRRCAVLWELTAAPAANGAR